MFRQQDSPLKPQLCSAFLYTSKKKKKESLVFTTTVHPSVRTAGSAARLSVPFSTTVLLQSGAYLQNFVQHASL